MLRYCISIFFLFSFLTHISAQNFNLYSEIHWRPDQAFNTTRQEFRKIVGDSMGNTYVLYWTDRDFRVKNSEFLCMKRITTIGSSSVIMKLDPSGNFLWGMGLNGGFYSDMACDKKGNLVVSGIGSWIPGHYLLAYLPNCSVMAERANRILMKVNPEGQLVWEKKEIGDMHETNAQVWLDDAGNVYQQIMLERRDLCFIEKYEADGIGLWTFELNNTNDYAINVNRAGDTYYACCTFKTRNGKMVYPEVGDKYEVWKIAADGEKTVIMSKPYRDYQKIDEWNSIRGDYFINHISFNADNSPVFWTSLLMQNGCKSICIAGKKYEEKNGSFVFAEIDTNGNVKSDLQKHTGTFVFERDEYEYRHMELSTRLGAIYCGNREWLFGAPVTEFHNEVNPGTVNRDTKLAYITYDANKNSTAWMASENIYLENYTGVGFNYMLDSTLYTWGRRFDAAIPAKPNYTFNWFYIERIKPMSPALNNAEEHVGMGNAVCTFNTGTITKDTVVSADTIVKEYSSLLYPNPTNANSIFQFEMPAATTENADATLYVFASDGRMMDNIRFKANAGENKVDVYTFGYAVGTYTIKVVCGEMVFTKTLIKI